MNHNSISKSTFLSLLKLQKPFVHDNELSDAFLRNLLHAQLHGYMSYRFADSLLSELPQSFTLHMASVRQFAAAQSTQTHIVCSQLASLLDEANIRATLLKGAAYIMANKANAEGRLISDIDIIVPRENLPDIEKLLQNNGWQPVVLEDYDEKYYREWSHELPPYINMESGITLDIHHTLIPESSGRIIDVNLLFESSKEIERNLYVPDDCHLVLHSAIHLLLNDDIEKGLRDCFDLHSLLLSLAETQKTDELILLFESSNCLSELIILIHLLKSLFGNDSDVYFVPLANAFHSISVINRIKVNCLYHAVFPKSRFLKDSSRSLARFYVYGSGHLSKMPFKMFIKHIGYKAYRGLVKKLFGPHVFSKSLQ